MKLAKTDWNSLTLYLQGGGAQSSHQIFNHV